MANRNYLKDYIAGLDPTGFKVTERAMGMKMLDPASVGASMLGAGTVASLTPGAIVGVLGFLSGLKKGSGFARILNALKSGFKASVSPYRALKEIPKISGLINILRSNKTKMLRESEKEMLKSILNKVKGINPDLYDYDMLKRLSPEKLIDKLKGIQYTAAGSIAGATVAGSIPAGLSYYNVSMAKEAALGTNPVLAHYNKKKYRRATALAAQQGKENVPQYVYSIYNRIHGKRAPGTWAAPRINKTNGGI